MVSTRTNSPQRPLRRLAWVGTIVGFWLLAQAAAFCPALHHSLHEDSGAPEHHCAAVVIQQGLIEPSPTLPQPVPPNEALVASPEVSQTVRVGWIGWLPPGRAPPAA